MTCSCRRVLSKVGQGVSNLMLSLALLFKIEFELSRMIGQNMGKSCQGQNELTKSVTSNRMISK